MIGQVKCSFCGKLFNFENPTGSLLATCQHCGKENTVGNSDGSHAELHILRNTPTLAGGKPCPNCQTMLEPDASLCIHCGYNLATGKRKRIRWLSSIWQKRKPILLGVLLLVGIIFCYMRFSAKPVDAGMDFETKKASAELIFRQRLDETSPPYVPKDPLELRQNTGQVIRGTLIKFAGTGTNRMVVIATEEGGKDFVPVNSQSREDRIRMDPEYREKYIRHMLNIQFSEPLKYPQKTK